MSMLDQIHAGDSIGFSVTVPEFRPADGGVLRYRLVPRFTTPVQVPILLTATPDGEEYVITAAPNSTASWAPGVYGWARWVEKTGARVVLDDLESHGQLEVLPDPATAAQGTDNRSQARRALDEATAALANASTRASTAGTAGVAVEYRIADRMMKFENASEAQSGLVKAVNYWQVEVNREDRRKRLEAGLGDPKRLQVRFL